MSPERMHAVQGKLCGLASALIHMDKVHCQQRAVLRESPNHYLVDVHVESLAINMQGLARDSATILKGLIGDVDGVSVSGPSWQDELLSRASCEARSRATLISHTTSDGLKRLLEFRDAVFQNDASCLRAALVFHRAELAFETIPAFIYEVGEFLRSKPA